MQDVARLADQDVAEDAPTLDAVPKVAPPDSERVGLFARLLGERAATGGDAVEASFPSEGEDVSETAEGEAQAAAPTPDVEPAARQGLLANIFGGGRGPDKSSSVPDNQVAFGTLLPYGVVKPICGLSKDQMGKVVAKYPDRRPTYKVYDSEPGNTGAHTFYVTGFDDGCARQFTASLAMFGSIEMHESLRYGLAAKVQPYSLTDKAYEKVKSRVCGVPRKTPCGKRVDRLADDTVFLSIYERFGGNAQWENLLLHSGEVVAQDKKGG
ncbi:hypothetical protein FDP25_15445 [Roseovarius sp. A21]|uniref:Uncharacterized protein n=2 Tax=Roseovarius bejariae TaxID=2576383 RepID=A0A844CTR3_9RHOB|nr:hypothetical protein [Roseovarius bejariae]